MRITTLIINFLSQNYLQSLLHPSSNQTMPGAQISPEIRNISQLFGSPIASIGEVQQPRLLTTLPEVRTPQNVDSDNSNSGYLRRSPRMILQVSANDPCPAVPTWLYQYNGLKCPSPATFNWEDQLPVKGATYCVGHKLEGMGPRRCYTVVQHLVLLVLNLFSVLQP